MDELVTGRWLLDVREMVIIVDDHMVVLCRFEMSLMRSISNPLYVSLFASFVDAVVSLFLFLFLTHTQTRIRTLIRSFASASFFKIERQRGKGTKSNFGVKL